MKRRTTLSLSTGAVQLYLSAVVVFAALLSRRQLDGWSWKGKTSLLDLPLYSAYYLPSAALNLFLKHLASWKDGVARGLQCCHHCHYCHPLVPLLSPWEMSCLAVDPVMEVRMEVKAQPGFSTLQCSISLFCQGNSRRGSDNRNSILHHVNKSEDMSKLLSNQVRNLRVSHIFW